MDEATLRRIGFPGILDRLANLCSFKPAQELAQRLRPSAEFDEVARRQREVVEAAALLADGSGPAGVLPDVRAAVGRAAKGGRLLGSDLAALAEFLAGAAAMGRLIAAKEESYPALAAYGSVIADFGDLVRAIRQAIRDDGAVLNNASPKLAALRAQGQVLQQRLRDRLESLLKTLAREGALQEALITTRNGRFTLPVRSTHRSRVPGIVHDHSASGATLFIEPSSVVDLNNQLRENELAAQREAERILSELSSKVAAAAATINTATAAYAELEFALARARLAQQLGGAVPDLIDEPRVDFAAARNPLLGEAAVPIDIAIGGNFNVLVITGPNTGGKTAALKTLGLLTVMIQSGLQPPCKQAVAGVFRQVFADIGDEQSMEQNLSTFSAHLKNILPIIPTADERSLILLDEIGAGTDPEEGSALAIALLDHLRQVGARTVATTHYGRVKLYALQRERVAVAAVEFDAETLQPTYRLVIGSPGRSNALMIAARLGLPRSVVDEARSHLSRGSIHMDDAIANLEAERTRLQQQRDAVVREREALSKLQAELRRQQADLEQRRRRLADEIRGEARSRVNRTLTEADQLVRELRQLVEKTRSADIEQVAERVRDNLRNAYEQAEADIRAIVADDNDHAKDKLTPLPPLAPGVEVWLPALRQIGTVLEMNADDTLLVQAGTLKVRVPVGDVSAPPAAQTGVGGEPAPDRTPAAAAGNWWLQKAQEVGPEVSLRGLTVDEAMERLAKYMDDAYLAGLDTVRIIHGKGAGILRRAVHDVLRNDSRVAGFRLAGPREGSFGVTVVNFK